MTLLAWLPAAVLATQLAIDAPPPPAPLRARVSDPAVIRAAVQEALIPGDAAPPRGDGRVLSGDAHAGFTRAVDAARVPGCLNTDALKHQPPKIGAIDFGGLMALPFWLTAIARGKCN